MNPDSQVNIALSARGRQPPGLCWIEPIGSLPVRYSGPAAISVTREMPHTVVAQWIWLCRPM